MVKAAQAAFSQPSIVAALALLGPYGIGVTLMSINFPFWIGLLICIASIVATIAIYNAELLSIFSGRSNSSDPDRPVRRELLIVSSLIISEVIISVVLFISQINSPPHIDTDIAVKNATYRKPDVVVDNTAWRRVPDKSGRLIPTITIRNAGTDDVLLSDLHSGGVAFVRNEGIVNTTRALLEQQNKFNGAMANARSERFTPGQSKTVDFDQMSVMLSEDSIKMFKRMGMSAVIVTNVIYTDIRDNSVWMTPYCAYYNYGVPPAWQKIMQPRTCDINLSTIQISPGDKNASTR